MKTDLDCLLIKTNYTKVRRNLLSKKLKILTTARIKIIRNKYDKREGIRKISNTENDNKIKNANNKEN